MLLYFLRVELYIVAEHCIHEPTETIKSENTAYLLLIFYNLKDKNMYNIDFLFEVLMYI